MTGWRLARAICHQVLLIDGVACTCRYAERQLGSAGVRKHNESGPLNEASLKELVSSTGLDYAQYVLQLRC